MLLYLVLQIIGLLLLGVLFKFALLISFFINSVSILHRRDTVSRYWL